MAAAASFRYARHLIGWGGQVMGARGAMVLGFFGALFAALTLYWQWHLSGPVLAVPFVVFIGICWWASRVARLPGVGVVPSARVRRSIKYSTVAEGIGLCAAANILILFGRIDLLLPTMALIVGLHFLPIALVASFRPFYLLGTALTLSAAIGFAVRAPLGGEIAGLLSAAGLWIAAVLAVRRDLAARQAAPARA